MKKIVITSLFLIIIFPTILLAQNKGTGANMGGGLRVTPRNVEELKDAIDLRESEFEKGLAYEEEEGILQIKRNQNRFKGAVQNLMIMENMVGDNSLKLREHTQNLNQLSARTLELEMEFSERGFFKKMFFGQKNKSKQEFSKIIEEREFAIGELKKIFENCECSNEVKNIFEEQLNEISLEHERLGNFYAKESKKKGILSWLINVFDKNENT